MESTQPMTDADARGSILSAEELARMCDQVAEDMKKYPSMNEWVNRAMNEWVNRAAQDRMALVRAVLDAASAGRKCDMNDLACMTFSQEDREQFAQLIGYSVSGFGELSYARRKVLAKADAFAHALFEQRQRRLKRARQRKQKVGSR